MEWWGKTQLVNYSTREGGIVEKEILKSVTLEGRKGKLLEYDQDLLHKGGDFTWLI